MNTADQAYNHVDLAEGRSFREPRPCRLGGFFVGRFSRRHREDDIGRIDRQKQACPDTSMWRVHDDALLLVQLVLLGAAGQFEIDHDGFFPRVTVAAGLGELVRAATSRLRRTSSGFRADAYRLAGSIAEAFGADLPLTGVVARAAGIATLAFTAGSFFTDWEAKLIMELQAEPHETFNSFPSRRRGCRESLRPTCRSIRPRSTTLRCNSRPIRFKFRTSIRLSSTAPTSIFPRANPIWSSPAAIYCTRTRSIRTIWAAMSAT